MTEILMMTLTPQLRKMAKKESITSFLNPRTTMKLEEKENLKLRYVNKIQATSSQINNINDSDKELFEKITEVTNITRKTQILKANHHSKNVVTIVDDMETALLNADKNNKITKKTTKFREPNKSLHQYMEKDQNLLNKNLHSKNSSGKPLPNNSNYSKSPYNTNYRGRSAYQRKSQNFSQNRYSRSHRNN